MPGRSNGMRGKRLPALLLLLLAAGWMGACAKRQTPPPTGPYDLGKGAKAHPQLGIASWYGPGFHGKRTSSGEVFDMYDMTAAHRSLPLGTPVRVTNLANNRTVEVRINDRGPFVRGRVIDLSYAAARMLDMVESGTAPVRVEVLNPTAGAGSAKPSRKPRYELQLGAFVQYANALNLVESLKVTLGAEAVRVVPVQLEERKIYRVRVGGYSEREEALAMARSLSSRGYPVLVVEEYPVAGGVGSGGVSEPNGSSR